MAVKGKNTRKRWVDPDDAPVLTGREIARPDARWRIGDHDVSAAEGKQAFRDELIGKTRINIHLDNDVVAYFKQQAGGRGYQTLINKALRREMSDATESRDLQEIREEIQHLRAEVRAFAQQSLLAPSNRPLERLQAPTAPPFGSGTPVAKALEYGGAIGVFGGQGRQQLANVA
jgi:uncharacterized protein (DUF4415 family)